MQLESGMKIIHVQVAPEANGTFGDLITCKLLLGEHIRWKWNVVLMDKSIYFMSV